jgi:single-strand DNA-binding protein
MKHHNRVTIVGELTEHPKINKFQNENEVANFSLKVVSEYKDFKTKETKEFTTYIKIAIYDKNAIQTIKNKVSEGSTVYIEGELKTRKSMSVGDTEKTITEVVVKTNGGNFYVIDANEFNNFEETALPSMQPLTMPNFNQDISDDIPF